MVKLKSCPFCDTPATGVRETKGVVAGRITTFYNIRCDSCLHGGIRGIDKDKVIEKWNMREGSECTCKPAQEA